jgi:hypothetical protein
MEGTGTDFHIQRLHNYAALFGPVILQALDQTLETVQIGHW